jgi:predicted ATPase
MDDALVRAVELRPPMAGEARTGYPWDLPVVRGLADGLALDPAVTYLIGGTTMHEQSHGEAFLAVMLNRFGPGGRVSDWRLVTRL